MPDFGPPPAPRPKKKSNLWKWLLGCGCLILLLGALSVGGVVYYFSRAITTDPVRAKEIANTMVQFDVPDGYQMKFAADMFGIKFAAWTRTDENQSGLFCMMMRFPKSLNVNKAQMESQMNAQMQKQGQSQGQLKAEASETVTLSMGSGSVQADCRILIDQNSGRKMKQYLIFLEKPDGMVMIQIIGPLDDFDSVAMQRFLDSAK